MEALTFRSRVMEDGHLYCPRNVLDKLLRRGGVTMKITLQIEGEDEDDLDVTEEEIQRIMELQGIGRKEAIRCLEAAGALADDAAFEERVKATRERGNLWSVPRW